ncbi:FAD/FMN-containing dehydrogenase [Geosmithia morbida]|uniref:FAD/FMN-containing dehydrogenase n=1 Tax=Geosmithia morbida TaxID=1094350 RepID=A0A9P5D392_9HYPO|nr:FAD/FMN-containing dehydrogenase [Geosmithia morbida]KAF4120274.1 FAD/FMN-containing dehydrogenase [Geosmithia morbida]
MATLTQQPDIPQAASLIEAGLQARILSPTDPEYAAREESYWSSSAKIKPACIIQPRTAEEVATAVKALAASGQKFAVRSGGHTNWAGSNNIAGGVTIDLVHLDKVVFNADSETASIGPGNRWRQVYAELNKHGRAVAGGREGNVGVAGLLLGGGNTFYTARQGFGCDNVVAFQVVLANGDIVVADEKGSHSDLYRVLKGGSNNFGIVTEFTMKAIPSDKVWGGMAFFPKQTTPGAIEALTTFADNVPNDVNSNLVTIFTYMPDFKDIVVATLYANVAGVEKAPAYEKWLALPEIMNTVKMTSISEMAFEYNIPTNYYDTWFTLCFKNDPRIITKATELHEKLVDQLKEFIPDGDFITQCLFQPLPTIFGQRGVEAGGNIMGMDRHQTNGILFLAVVMARTPEQEAFAYPKVQAWIKEVRDFAATIDGGNLEWVYLNYADKSQDPLGSYGAENIRKMKDAAAKYDPDQVFQKLCPGGFKISDVKDQ